MVSLSAANNSIQKQLKYVSQTFHREEQTMQWFGLTLYSISQWEKKKSFLTCQIRSRFFLSMVTDVECLQSTVKVRFVAG